LDVINDGNYVSTGACEGLPESKVVPDRHVFRNSLLPIGPIASLTFGGPTLRRVSCYGDVLSLAGMGYYCHP